MFVTSPIKKSIAWLSFQYDGSVSCGLSDRYFTTIPIQGKNFLFNAYNRITLEFQQDLSSQNFSTIDKPHLTFHPPIYFHLTDNNKKEQWAGMADVDIVLNQDSVFPWVRLISREIDQIDDYQPRDTSDEHDVIIPNINKMDSLGLGIDIINQTQLNNYKNVVDVIDWKSRKYIVFYKNFAPQNPSLIWYYYC